MATLNLKSRRIVSVRPAAPPKPASKPKAVATPKPLVTPEPLVAPSPKPKKPKPTSAQKAVALMDVNRAIAVGFLTY